jgi:hypothetical protein
MIHAYGGDSNQQYTYPSHDVDNVGKVIFGRKVLITWENIGNPRGFGRVKLWD